LKLHGLAAQITLPFPSLLQLASEFTEQTERFSPATGGCIALVDQDRGGAAANGAYNVAG
jgi:hypothetical protein